MGFGDFLSKAAKLAGKAIVAVASEVMNQGGTTITKNYLEQAKKLNIDSRQRDMIQHAEKLNNRLSEKKRSEKNISDDIKNNKTKIAELKGEVDGKGIDVWVLLSKLIEKENFHRPVVFNGDKYIVFSDGERTKILLSSLVNELCEIKLVDGSDEILCGFINKTIPEIEINSIPEGFLLKLIPLLDEYKSISKSNEDKIQEISRENSLLDQKLVSAKEKVSITDSELKPLLNDIKEFCSPLIEEQKERNARSRR
ncbi:TPA: hypothetical protein ACQEDL_004526 [Yersinia enterocolitica]